MGVFGDTLRQARAQKGVTLKEAEQATRINRHHLSALEDENFAVLPALIYQRGIVRNYATYLDLDPGKLLAMFEEARGGETTTDLVAAVKPLEMPAHWAPNFAIIAFMVVMSAIVFAWIYSLSFNRPEATSTLPPVIPTVTPIPEDRLALPSPTPLPTVAAAAPAEQPATVAPPANSLAVDPGAAQQPGLAPPASTQPVVIQTTATAAPPALGAAMQQVPPTAVPPTATMAPPTQVPPTPAPTVAPTPPQQAAQPAPRGPTATIRVLAQGDIQVSVVADGTTVFSGWLGAGGATDWYTATSFEVYTSDGSQTLFENAQTGQQFYMGYGPNETYYLGA